MNNKAPLFLYFYICVCIVFASVYFYFFGICIVFLFCLCFYSVLVLYFCILYLYLFLFVCCQYLYFVLVVCICIVYRPKKTGETVNRRQNDGSVKAVSPRHCAATSALRNRQSSEIQGTALGKCLQAWPVYIQVHACGCSA